MKSYYSWYYNIAYSLKDYKAKIDSMTSSSKLLFNSNDVINSIYGFSVNAQAILGIDAITEQTMPRLGAKKIIIPMYLFWLTSWFWSAPIFRAEYEFFLGLLQIISPALYGLN